MNQNRIRYMSIAMLAVILTIGALCIATSAMAEGENDMVLVLDISGSMRDSEIVSGTGVSFLDYEKELANNILDDEEFRDDYVGVVAFGGQAYVVSPLVYFGNNQTRASLKDTIRAIDPTGQLSTDLEDGLSMAEEILANSTGAKDVIILSDGQKINYESSLAIATQMKNKSIKLHFIHVMSSPTSVLTSYEKIARAVDASFIQTTYPRLIVIENGQPADTVAEFDAINDTIANSTGSPLYVADAYNGQPGFQWDHRSFTGFWYDPDDGLQTETMTILSKERDAPTQDTLKYPDDREIGEGSLIYETHPVFREYEMHQDIPDASRTTQTEMEEDYDGDGISDEVPQDLLDRDIGLCVESDNPGGDCGYFLEGWMGEEYVAIDGRADKLCKLLVEFEDGDKKTLSIGEEWDLGSGYSLTAKQIDLKGDKVWFSLKKDGREIDNEVTSTGAIDRPQERVYTYTADLADEEDIPVFSCYVDAISIENDTVEIMYVFLIDEDAIDIDIHDSFGSNCTMEALTANSKEIVITNDETKIVLDPGTTKQIMGNMFFRIENDTSAIRFYPFVEQTGGGGHRGGGGTCNITDTDGDGVPDVWDTDNSTPAGYWVNAEGVGRRWGDMNGDGKLTSLDALMILQAAVESN